MNFLSFFARNASFSNDQIDVRLTSQDITSQECGIDDGYLFYIYRRHGLKKIGYVSLRLGESPSLYYLGHIGYRIDEPYRGNGYARQACELIKPFARELGLLSVVITTDTDNMASRKTCERLGCALEAIVPVPPEYQPLCSGSQYKCRYIWRILAEQGD
ncbi:MAG: GNAT family N-acetyltransferase [Clostridia bacterium]|nr:GNAT family N-acetyltransferase [Clostridia bacterium]